MNAEQCAIVQRLISDLDDTHFLYLKFKPLLSHTHVRFLVSQMIDLHATIADELARQMRLTGGLAARRGVGALARLRARAACWWMAFGSTDSEMSCLERIVRREDRLAQEFQRVIAQVGDLPRNLQDQLLVLERTGYRIESLVRLMQASSSDASQPAAIPAYVPARARLRR
ncbi:MAG TPA: hypothetical protein VFI32_07965 [Rhodanobacteraceae bacterium]|nr:hypothetical protein [Rhodanobacteraceae bacterium]